ncbi:MAG: radical SAM protein [Verrucomicrobiota bacterium]|nr:radical SAM protein [Verrucomicrobiota bacterium]
MSTDRGQVPSGLAAVRDHNRSFSGLTIVYPVISRRAGGLSLGVNLNPDKRCNFNCAYCEVNRRLPGRAGKVDPARILDELTLLVRWAKEGRLLADEKFHEAGNLARTIKDISFSGDGEPTLAENFSECVEAAAEVRRRENLDQTKIVLITNATGLDKDDVKKGLAVMDANNGEVWAKLDAGTETWYWLINRSPVRFERILANILNASRERPIVIQSLFMRVHGRTMPEAELLAYCERLRSIVVNGGKIKEVHAYTIARPVPEPWVEKLTERELEAIGAVIRGETGLSVRTFA